MKHSFWLTFRATVMVLIASSTLACNFSDRSEIGEAQSRVSVRRQLLMSAIERVSERDDSGGDWPYFSDPELQKLVRQGETDLDLTVALIKDKSTPEAVKTIAVRLLGCVPLPRYLDVLAEIRSSSAAGLISENVVRAAILPGAEWSTTLSLNYEDPRLIAALRAIADSSDAASRVRESVQSVLSGAQAKYIKAYNTPQNPLPKWACV